MWRFARGVEASGVPMVLVEQNRIVDSIPVGGPYPDLWENRVVRVVAAYVPNSL
jgi:hypothetical protein